MDIFYYILGFILVLKAFPVEAGDICSYRYSCFSRYCTRYTYCEYGCCGTSDSYYDGACCTYNLAGIIAGAVIGGLVGLGLLIALIVFCCVAANSSGKRRGAVIQPMNTTQISTVAVTNAAVAPGPSSYPGLYGPVIYGHPAGQQAPPPYTPFNTGASGATDPAYPPPPPKYY